MYFLQNCLVIKWFDHTDHIMMANPQLMNWYLERSGVFSISKYIQIFYLQKDRGVGIPSLLTPGTQKKELDFCTEYHGYLPDASFHLAPHVKQS